jgi:hypothetical protein
MPTVPPEPAPAHDLPDLDAFLEAIRTLGIATVVIAWQDEYGQVPEVPGVVFDQLARFSLLAYHRPTSRILRCQQQGDGAVRRVLVERLRDQGLVVEERSRNEVKYRT